MVKNNGQVYTASLPREVDVDQVIFDNYDIFLAHILVWDKKFFLYPRFDKKEVGEKRKRASTNQENYTVWLRDMKMRESQSAVQVDSELGDKMKRRRTSIISLPKGASADEVEHADSNVINAATAAFAAPVPMKDEVKTPDSVGAADDDTNAFAEM